MTGWQCGICAEFSDKVTRYCPHCGHDFAKVSDTPDARSVAAWIAAWWRRFLYDARDQS